MNMNSKKKLILSTLSIATAIVLSGCDAQEWIQGTTTTPSTPTVPVISGSVPGTLIEAFCKDGSYYKTHSTKDGSSFHPFELEIPKDLDCKLVMTTNENDPDISKRIVTPIFLDNGKEKLSYFSLNASSDLGFVPLSTVGEGIQNVLVVTTLDDNLKLKNFSYDPLDKDKDGIPNVYEDDDHDGKYNKDDDDDDNDGIPDDDDDDHKDDHDGDGIHNDYDKDKDGDSIKDNDDDDDDKDDDDKKNHDDDKDDDDDEKDHDDDEKDDEKDNESATIILPTGYIPDSGRLLGSQCSQCHGTNGVSTNGWDSIKGEDNLAHEMFDDDALMDAQAKGYTTEEINLIEQWLNK